jgi:hypothetical protein
MVISVAAEGPRHLPAATLQTPVANWPRFVSIASVSKHRPPSRITPCSGYLRNALHTSCACHISLSKPHPFCNVVVVGQIFSSFFSPPSSNRDHRPNFAKRSLRIPRRSAPRILEVRTVFIFLCLPRSVTLVAKHGPSPKEKKGRVVHPRLALPYPASFDHRGHLFSPTPRYKPSPVTTIPTLGPRKSLAFCRAHCLVARWSFGAFGTSVAPSSCLMPVASQKVVAFPQLRNLPILFPFG